jgi:hypothetical protein
VVLHSQKKSSCKRERDRYFAHQRKRGKSSYNTVGRDAIQTRGKFLTEAERCFTDQEQRNKNWARCKMNSIGNL